MANLIDNTYFVNDIDLPVDNIEPKLTQLITMYEPIILSKILGFDLYKKMIDGLAVTPTPLAIWTDLKNGKQFQSGDSWYNWRGLVNATKDSIIAYYIWLKYVQTDSSFVSGSGMKQLKSENSEADLTNKLVSLNYNKMVEMIHEMDFFINENIADYETFKQSDWTKFLFLI